MSTLGALLILVVAIGAAFLLLYWHRRQQIVALENALYPEVESMRFQAAVFANELARRHDRAGSLDLAFLHGWRLSAPSIYPAAGAQLGLLPADALDRIGYFHAQLAEARARIADAKAFGVETLSSYRLLSNVLRAYNHVEPWTSSKARRLGTLPGGKAEVGAAARLLEQFEAAAQEPLASPYCWADVCEQGEAVAEPSGNARQP